MFQFEEAVLRDAGQSAGIPSPEFKPHLDAICRTVQALFAVPIAVVSLVGEHTQYLVARAGLDVDETARDDSFCAHAILSDDVLVVEDATADARFADKPAVTGPTHLRFYAGAPLILECGTRIGALCAIDRAPRVFTREDRQRLTELAALSVAQIWLPKAEQRAREKHERYRQVLSTAQDAFVSANARGIITEWNGAAETIFGWSESEAIGAPLAALIIPERFRADHEKGFQRYFSTGQSNVVGQRRLEMTALRRDGTEFSVEMAMSAGVSGDEASVHAFVRDITNSKAREDALRSSEARYRLLADNSTDMIVHADLTTTRLYVSPGCKPLLGFEPDELVGTKPLDGIHPDDIEQMRAAIAEVTSGTLSRATSQQRYRRKDGTWVWVENCYSLTRDPLTSAPTGYIVSARDISRRREVEEDLRRSETRRRESEERLALALEGGCDGIWEWNAKGGALWYSDQALATLGYQSGDLGRSISIWSTYIHPDDRVRTEKEFADHLCGRVPSYESEYRLRRKDGQYAWIMARGRAVERDPRGWAARVVGTMIDVTERKEAQERIAHLARHDVLTDLPNRRLFHECMTRKLAGIERHSGAVALLWGDLDGFKAVNDSLGHAAGDAVLSEMATRLRSVVRAEDVIARLGGDEFAVLQCSDASPAEDAACLARRLIEAVARPVDVGTQTVEVGLSLGITLAPDDGLDADRLVRRADLALYRAKADGRNTFRFFEAAMDEAVEAKRRLEADLRLALTREQFELHYQPIVDAATGRVRAAEALMRWRHPTRGLVSPAEFIPLAEETGLIATLGARALRTACRDAASWPGGLRVAVNISAHQFRQVGLTETVMNALATSGLPPHRLELEITETVLMQDKDEPEILATLHRLRDLGVKTALDDFGTGYSSLSYLRRFPFDRLKIDRSFVHDLSTPGTARIVRAMIGLGQGLNMKITAEGVESAIQLDTLRREGCDEVQGFLFSRPVPLAAFVTFLNRIGLEAAA